MLKLEGEVSLRDFRTATDALLEILEELSAEADPDVEIDWVVSDLEFGSTVIECEGHLVSDESQGAMEYVVSAYTDLAERMSGGALGDLSERVQAPARRLAGLINGRIPRIVMGVGEEAVRTIEHRLELPPEEKAPGGLPIKYYRRTSVKGEIVLGSKRGGRKFTLEESYSGKVYRCYPPKDLWPLVADCLGKDGAVVIVEGLLNAEKRVVSDITAIELLPIVSSGEWRLAVGAAPSPEQDDTLTSEEAVRRVRDGED